MNEGRAPHPLRQTLRATVALGRTLPLAGRAVAFLVWAWIVLLGLVPVAVAVIMAVAVGASVEVVSEGVDSPAWDRLVWAMVLFAVLFGVQLVVGTWGNLLLERTGRQLNWRLRERVMRASMTPTGVHHIEDPEMQRAFQGARDASASGAGAGFALEQLPGVVASRIGIVANLVVLTVLAWPFGLVMVPVTVINQFAMARSVARVLSGSRGFASFTYPNYQRDLAITPGAAKEVRVFGLGTWLRSRYDTGVADAIATATGGGAASAGEFTPSLLGVFALNAAVSAAGVIVLAVMAADGDLGVGELTLAISAVMALRPMFNLSDAIIPFGTGVLDRVSDAQAIAERVAGDVVRPGDGRPVEGLPARSIRFEGVSFQYPGTTAEVLAGVDLELRAGERTAIVGLNGAGKTTLVKLLCRFYEPTAGRILVDDTVLTEVDPVVWRRQLAVLFQDFVRYELSARDNIRYGAVAASTPGGDHTLDAGVQLAAARVGADRILASLASGLDTPLSPRFSGGTDLSGGEWQRVAFARAMFAVHAGARVLVLDEPTANLDVRAEAELYDQFLDLTASGVAGDAGALTTVVISHRFSTVRQADRIVVLADGHIVEDGSHDDLVAAGGQYAAMFAAQARRFVDGPDPDDPSRADEAAS